MSNVGGCAISNTPPPGFRSPSPSPQGVTEINRRERDSLSRKRAIQRQGEELIRRENGEENEKKITNHVTTFTFWADLLAGTLERVGER